MKNDRKWIIVRIDGKIAAVSTDYRQLASISARLAKGERHEYGEISAVTAGMEEVWRLRKEVSWDDMMLFGTDFQKKVWRKLYDLTHNEDGSSKNPELICYSDFAELCRNRAGVRAVAHAIGLNPVSVIIPCHLIVPKEAIDKMKMINKKAEATIFKGVDLCLNSILNDNSMDFGEYALGKKLKRELIKKEFA
jgi:O-6-methylguanine DNA methyltransferase